MMSVLQKWSILLLLGLLVGGMLVVKRPLPIHAQSGCALRINEIMYDPETGAVDDEFAEWVELYVASPIGVDTTFFITDQEPLAAGIFNKQFIVPAGTDEGTYIIVHNDGNKDNDGSTGVIGIYNTISFYMGNNSSKLRNSGDEIVLYQGGDVDGTPCDYVEYLTPNSSMPPGFNWDNSSCANPSSAQDSNKSISLDPNGFGSDSACDWTESGLNSPNDPDNQTGEPDTQGYNNTTTPTAVTLASFKAANNQPGMVAAGYVVVIMSLLTGWLWQIKKRD